MRCWCTSISSLSDVLCCVMLSVCQPKQQQVLGAKRKNLAGYSSSTVQPHQGFIYGCALIQQTPPGRYGECLICRNTFKMMCAEAWAWSKQSCLLEGVVLTQLCPHGCIQEFFTVLATSAHSQERCLLHTVLLSPLLGCVSACSHLYLLPPPPHTHDVNFANA